MGVAQVSTKLKVGVMWDHNGTYMEGFGFQYRDQQIRVELNRMAELEGEPHTFDQKPPARCPVHAW